MTGFPMYLLQTAPPPAGPMPTPQVVLALTLACSMLVIVIELVRRQKLREEYAWLWMSTAVVLMVLALDSSILGWLGAVAQAQSPLSILFFGANVFLMLVALQFSVRLTKLTFRSKTLSQKVAVLEQELAELRAELRSAQEASEAPEPEPAPGKELEVDIPRPEEPAAAPESAKVPEPRRDPVS